MSVTVWVAAGSPELLARTVAQVAGVATGAVRIRHRCQQCGSQEHGRPSVAAPRVASSFAVSRARCGGFEAVAVAKSGEIGVDIESIARVAAHPVGDVLLHREEHHALQLVVPDARPRWLTNLWVAKEALVKASGYGLTVDFRTIHLVVADGVVEIRELPSTIARRGAPSVQLFTTAYGDVVGAVASIAR